MTDPAFDPTDNPRFESLGEGLYSERISPMVTLYYDPATQAARASFSSLPYLKIADSYHSLGGSFDTLEVNFSERMLECFGKGLDPVTGADLAIISTAGIMTILKDAFDLFIRERTEGSSLAG